MYVYNNVEIMLKCKRGKVTYITVESPKVSNKAIIQNVRKRSEKKFVRGKMFIIQKNHSHNLVAKNYKELVWGLWWHSRIFLSEFLVFANAELYPTFAPLLPLLICAVVHEQETHYHTIIF
jgi:hypothetical protein